jgi:hypothetical protein
MLLDDFLGIVHLDATKALKNTLLFIFGALWSSS